MANLIPVIIWDGKNANLLVKTLKSIDYLPEAYLYTSMDYENLHKLLSRNFLSNTNLQISTTGKPGIGRMKNRAILDLSKEHPDDYMMFLEAGDEIIGSPDVTGDLIGDPVFFCDDIGEYGPLWKISEDCLPLTTLGIIFRATWVLSKGLEFEDTEFSFIRALYQELPEKVWSVDMNVELGRERNILEEIKDIVEYKDIFETDEDYYIVRHTLTRMVLDGIVSGTEGIEGYIQYAYTDKRI